MGTTWAVVAAQDVVETFTRKVMEKCGPNDSITYIDNIYIFTQDEATAKGVGEMAVELAAKWKGVITSQ